MDHIGRTVGVFEAGNLIHDNFISGTRSKMAFRHAITSNLVTNEAPVVDNDELEYVMYASADEVLGSRPGNVSPSKSSTSSMFPPIKSPNSPRLMPNSPRILTGLASSSNEAAPLFKHSLKLSPTHGSEPSLSVASWLVTILEQRERICGGGGAGPDQTEEEGLASMAAILRVRSADDAPYFARNKDGVSIITPGHNSAHLPSSLRLSSGTSSKGHLLKINQRNQPTHQQEQMSKMRDFREATTGFTSLSSAAESPAGRFQKQVEYTDATVGHKSIAVLSPHAGSGRVAEVNLDPTANQKCPPQFR